MFPMKGHAAPPHPLASQLGTAGAATASLPTPAQAIFSGGGQRAARRVNTGDCLIVYPDPALPRVVRHGSPSKDRMVWDGEGYTKHEAEAVATGPTTPSRKGKTVRTRWWRQNSDVALQLRLDNAGRPGSRRRRRYTTKMELMPDENTLPSDYYVSYDNSTSSYTFHMEGANDERADILNRLRSITELEQAALLAAGGGELDADDMMVATTLHTVSDRYTDRRSGTDVADNALTANSLAHVDMAAAADMWRRSYAVTSSTSTSRAGGGARDEMLLDSSADDFGFVRVQASDGYGAAGEDEAADGSEEESLAARVTDAEFATFLRASHAAFLHVERKTRRALKSTEDVAFVLKLDALLLNFIEGSLMAFEMSDGGGSGDGSGGIAVQTVGGQRLRLNVPNPQRRMLVHGVCAFYRLRSHTTQYRELQRQQQRDATPIVHAESLSASSASLGGADGGFVVAPRSSDRITAIVCTRKTRIPGLSLFEYLQLTGHHET